MPREKSTYETDCALVELRKETSVRSKTTKVEESETTKEEKETKEERIESEK